MREHAFRLARLSPSGPGAEERISAELLQIMEAFPHMAAYVTNPAFRVLTANPAATALMAPLQRPDGILAGIFLDGTAREYFVNWDDVARAAVSALRHSAGFTPVHPEVSPLIARLYDDSADFRRLWDDRTVSGLALTRKTIRHPRAGLMQLNYQTFDVRSAPGQQLTVATADAGSPSAAALRVPGEQGRDVGGIVGAPGVLIPRDPPGDDILGGQCGCFRCHAPMLRHHARPRQAEPAHPGCGLRRQGPSPSATRRASAAATACRTPSMIFWGLLKTSSAVKRSVAQPAACSRLNRTMSFRNVARSR